MARITEQREHDQARPQVLFICGSRNQTTQLHAVARALPHAVASFTPFYGTRFVSALRSLGVIENTIGGHRLRACCVEYLRAHGLSIDLDGATGKYDLVVSCTDLVIPENVRGKPLVIVQEGLTDPDTVLSRVARKVPALPLWIAGTSLTGLSGAYDRFCVASDGYRDFFVARGADPAKLCVTGMPNFDHCASYRNAEVPYRHYVLACTSDLRETYRFDHRAAFIRKVKRIAAGRRVVFKLHPNEHVGRACAEIYAQLPNAVVHVDGSAEELIAHCDVLIAQVSSVVYVGIALGKEVHSDLDLAQLERLAPVQNGGRSAENIAAVCSRLLQERTRPQAAALQTKQLATVGARI